MSVIYWVWSHMRQNEQPASLNTYLSSVQLPFPRHTNGWLYMYRTLIWHADQYNYQVRLACTSQLLYLWSPIGDSMNISIKNFSKMAQKQTKNTCVIWDSTTYPWLISFSVHSKCLITIFWFFVRGAYIWSKYYIIMTTFCWHIIITSDYKLDGIMEKWANPHLKNNKNICHW